MSPEGASPEPLIATQVLGAMVELVLKAFWTDASKGWARQAAGMVNRTGRVYLGMTNLVTIRITKKQARVILRGMRQQGANGLTLLVDSESILFYPF